MPYVMIHTLVHRVHWPTEHWCGVWESVSKKQSAPCFLKAAATCDDGHTVENRLPSLHQHSVSGKMGGGQHKWWMKWKVVSHALISTSKNNRSILKEHISFYKNEYFFKKLTSVTFHFQTIFHWHWDVALENINYHCQKPGSQFKWWHLHRPWITQAEQSVGCQGWPLK